MSRRLTSFCFDRDALNLDGQIDFVAEIPRGERDRQRLFITLQQQLRFPYYFGHNWDALYECLRDFHWIKNRRVLIAHHDLPQFGAHDTRVYLEILADAVDDWVTRPGDHELVVLFPQSARAAIAELLGEQSEPSNGNSSSRE
jgi:RNAse (barnase) inhibitor barstar